MAGFSLATVANAAVMRGPDFNRDGFADLAIGVPGEDIGSGGSLIVDAGLVYILYGSDSGLEHANGLIDFLHQDLPDVEGGAQANDHFGAALAWGDFDNDCFEDLAVGIPFTTVGAATNAGAVQIFYGSEDGFATSNDVIFTRDSPGIADSPGAGDFWGDALAAGDFNNDHYDDLAIGSALDDVSGDSDAGSVQIIYGSETGLDDNAGPGNVVIHQDWDVMDDDTDQADQFGRALVSADFNCDSYDDLAVSVPGEDAGASNAGAVHVIYGSSNGLDSDPSTNADEHWDQNDLTMDDGPESGDLMGYSLFNPVTLAAGNFNGDVDGLARDCDDLAIGVPYEDIGAVADAGAVYVLYGTSSGGLQVSSPDDDAWDQGTGIEGSVTANNEFGFTLSAGHFDNDGYDDLAITVLDDSNAGSVAIIRGGTNGLTSISDVLWNRDHASIPGSAAASEYWGTGLTCGDYDDDGMDDLAIGAPNAGTGGLVQALYLSSAIVPTIASGESWTQSAMGGASEADDGVGDVLAASRRKAGCPITP